MKKLTFFVILFTAFAKCPMYLCKGSKQHFTENTCVAYLEGNYYVGDCKSGNCSPAFGSSNSTCSLETDLRVLTSYPGTKCNSSLECFSQFCDQGVCKGLEKGQQCASNYDCGPGLFCNSTNKCSEQYESSCSDDYSCKNNAGCNLNKCAKYFSLQQGELLSKCPGSNRNLLCISGTCATLNGQAICIEPLTNLVDYPYSCLLGSPCSSTSDPRTGLTQQSECICGLSKSGTPFCELFGGDKPSVQFFNSLKKWTDSKEIYKCNTMERLEQSCISSWWGKNDYIEFLYYYLLSQYYPYIADAELCVLSLYIPEYYSAYQQYSQISDSHSTKLHLFSMAFIFMFLFN